MTELQEMALLCLFGRAKQRSKGQVTAVDLSAGKGAQPIGKPHDLLRWDRMDSLGLKGLLVTVRPGEPNGYVQLTPAGCREAERRLGNG
jgi:hypothetical protein